MARPPPPPPASLYANPLPFSFFASLVDRIGAVGAKRRGSRAAEGKAPKEQRLLEAWVDAVRREHDGALPEGTVVLFFRLFFPEEGVRRRYGLQELTLGEALETVYGAKRGTFRRWNAGLASHAGGRSASTGCLGADVARWLEKRERWGKGKAREMTLGRVDELLDELATTSTWSSADVQLLRLDPRRKARSVNAILADLLLPLSPSETAVMLQLILRDLSPLLYPPPSASGDVALTCYNSLAYNEIGLYDAMRAWHQGMPRLYQAVADLDWVAWQAEQAICSDRPLPRAMPRIGLPIKVPKTEKPGSCSRATRYLEGQVAVETKYDGERLQIHIDMSRPPQEQIRIFSKSGRDSTETRHLLIPIIRASLDLPLDPLSRALHPLLYQRLLSSASSRPANLLPSTKLVLDGEMVPFDESRSRIDEFWKLACAKGGNDALVQGTGTDVRPWNRPPAQGRGREEEESHETGATGATPSPRRSRRLAMGSSPASGSEAEVRRTEDERARNLHLMVVWFDVLLVDEESLLDEPYQRRRARLDSLVRTIPGFSMLSERVIINFDHKPSALENIRIRFAHIITRRCEGLMLKSLSSTYNDPRASQRWVKLKKDFVPGAGDTLDFHVVGASWQKQRGRELLVPPSVYTTFFVGLRADEFGADLPRQRKPHYHLLFSVSYGLSRAQLASLCYEIGQGQPERFDLEFGIEAKEGSAFRPVERRRTRGGYTVYDAACTSFTFSLAAHLRSTTTRPSVIFRSPRVMELNGAGFQRSAGCPYYELRFPRITKPSRPPSDEGAPLSLQALQLVAHEAAGAAPSGAAALVDHIWNAAVRDAAAQGTESVLEGGEDADSQERYEKEVRMWVGRLEKADGVVDGAGAVEVCAREEKVGGAVRAEKCARTDEGPRASTSREVLTPTVPIKVVPTVHAAVATEPQVPPQAPPATPPRPASSALARSISSPCARSDAPSPSQRLLSLARDGAAPTPAKRTPLAPSTSCPALHEAKRRRKSTTSSRLSLTSAVSTLLPALSPSSSLGGPSAATAYPSTAFAWSLYPPLAPDAPLPTPRHPYLDGTNFLASPLSVLWAAGLAPASLATPGSAPAGAPRQGFVFVGPGEAAERECVAWLEGEARGGKGKGGGTGAVVWVVRRDALESRGMWDLGMGGEVLTVL
ncbi:hypothetical protein JCM10450v2_003994 [Rhodotorula kratochvilovae]